MQNIIPLICVVFFSTIASMMVSTTLPTFLVEDLNLTYQQIGTIEGWAVFSAFVSKFFSGYASDKIQKRKIFVVSGTALSILSKGCFALTTGTVSIFIVKIFDRIAKGLRSCPSDAMLAEATVEKNRSFFYGAKYMLFAGGAMCGGYFAHILLKLLGNKFRLVFLLSLIPAIVAFFISKRLVKDPQIIAAKTQGLETAADTFATPPNSLNSLNFSKFFWKFLLAAAFLMFARFSESFLIIKARRVGFAIESIPLIAALYNLCAFGSALFTSLISRRIRKETLLKGSIVVQAIAHIVTFFAQTEQCVTASGILFGLHIGMSQVTLLAMVSGLAQKNNIATAFSVYYIVVAFSLLLSNILAGKLNTFFDSPSVAFAGGATFSIFSFCLLNMLTKSKRHSAGHQTAENPPL
ncbi:MAG: MFS transporter [Holosporales bacterium]|nr:MFS transporter [Holosporales bacterium]